MLSHSLSVEAKRGYGEKASRFSECLDGGILELMKVCGLLDALAPGVVDLFRRIKSGSW